MKLFTAALLTLLFFNTAKAQEKFNSSMEDWTYPYEVHKIALNDSLGIAYVDEGQGGKTLLFIHGLGSNLKAWHKNIEVLKKHYRCIALDLPGYGKSAKEDFSFSMSFFAESIRTFIDSLKLQNVVLIGHSMGGQIALHTLLQKRDNIEKLVLIAPAGFETFTEKEKLWFQTVFTSAVIKASTESQIVNNFKINFHKMPADAQFMIEDRLTMRQAKEYDNYCKMIPKCVMGMLKEPVFNLLSNIELPVKIIFGENDLLIPNRILHPTLKTVDIAEAGQKMLLNSQLLMIPEAGHFVQWEKANQINEYILNFLK